MDDGRRYEYEKENFELDTRGINYLIGAHGTGLIGCLALMKDYDTSPNLHGIGLFLSLFILGLIASAIAFIAAGIHRHKILAPYVYEHYAERETPRRMALEYLLPQAASLAFLLIALVALFFRVRHL
jgi:hypothetical protein